MKLRIIFILLSASLMFACSEDSDNTNESKVNVLIKGKQVTNTLKAVSNVELEKFLVNISEIEFDVDELDEASEHIIDSIVDAQELNGPFLVDLLSPEALSGLSIGSSYIPNAVYEEVEFDFEECIDQNNTEMFGYSILIEGNVDGQPFIIRSGEEWEMEIEFPNQADIIANGQEFQLYIEINVTNVIDQIRLIDFSQALDNNQNGIIEIDPNNEDGNAELAESIIETISESVELDNDNDDDNDD